MALYEVADNKNGTFKTLTTSIHEECNKQSIKRHFVFIGFRSNRIREELTGQVFLVLPFWPC
jgi:hypothetical protein